MWSSRHKKNEKILIMGFVNKSKNILDVYENCIMCMKKIDMWYLKKIKSKESDKENVGKLKKQVRKEKNKEENQGKIIKNR